MGNDLSNFFWQIPLHERSRKVTAFYFLNEGVMRFTRASQGRKNSPAMSQMCTDKMIGPLSPYTFGFVDDFLIHSPQKREKEELSFQEIVISSTSSSEERHGIGLNSHGNPKSKQSKRKSRTLTNFLNTISAIVD